MISLEFKPVGNRRNRPEWAMDDKSLMLQCVGKRNYVKYTIALWYWRENKSAREIAAQLNMTLGAVEKIIQRLARTPLVVEGPIKILRSPN